MRILFIGDIVASPGRRAVSKILPNLRKEKEIDIVIANAENLSNGRGATSEALEEIQNAGVDFFTSGDHIFWQRDTEHIFDDFPLIRPLNYPEGTLGEGYKVVDLGAKGKLLVINAMGRTSFGGGFSYLRDPFTLTKEVISQHKDENIDAIVVDFHAEATSEKHAFAFYLDGSVDAIVGTHTHVPTCDNRVLPAGTMYVTDLGMTGNLDSVIGVKSEIIIKSYLTAQNQRFEWEKTGKKAFRSVIIDTTKETIERFDQDIE